MNFLNYIQNKTVLIVGGGPLAIQNKEWFNSFDIIVRLNNYKKLSDTRTDIFFSYFGRNIKKTKEELIKDGVKYCINKCPNLDMTLSLSIYNVTMTDYRWIYDFRKNWWFCPLVSLTEKELINQIIKLNGNMPTVGLSAVMYFSNLNIKSLDIIGFDCFESGVHNLNEKWDNSGNHRPDLEKIIINKYQKNRTINWRQ